MSTRVQAGDRAGDREDAAEAGEPSGHGKDGQRGDGEDHDEQQDAFLEQLDALPDQGHRGDDQ
jgi:hypothetical protein